MFNKIIITSLFVLLFTTNIYSEINNQTLLIAKIINSPHAVGMGGVTANLVDAQSALYNPGAYGIFSLDNNFSISLPNNTTWLEQLADDLRLKTWSVGGGYSHIKINQEDNTQFKYAIGISYSEKIFDYGKVSLTDPSGNPLPPYYPEDKIISYTFSVGIDYYLKIGIGYSHKKYKSQTALYGGGGVELTEAKGSMYDIGLLVEFPLKRLLKIPPPSRDNITYDITPSFSFVKSNMGNSFNYFYLGPVTNLPKIRKVGYGLDVNIIQNSKKVISFQLIFEKEKDLVADLDAFTRKGLEVGLYETLYLRTGETNDKIFSFSDYSSKGFGFSLRGLLSAFSNSNTNNKTSNTMEYILKNIDIKFDWAKIRKDNHILDNTKFFKFSITI